MTAPLNIPDQQFYARVFSPWKGYGGFREVFLAGRTWTLVSPDRCYVLTTLAQQAALLPGDWVECGVYKGGTAMMLAKLASQQEYGMDLHLFDTFEGLPEVNAGIDIHKEGHFADVLYEDVKQRVQSEWTTTGSVVFHRGYIPETFKECRIADVSLAHIDVDIYTSVLDCCAFLYPRVVTGGFLVFDDYGFPSCPGARKAVDEFFDDKPEVVLVLPTGQAIVFKAPA